MVSVNGSTVPFATLALASATKRVTDGAVSYSNVPATLTSQGAGAFVNGDAQFYPAGTALDPVSFVIGAPSSSGGGTYTAAAFVAAAAAIPATPPATTGITLETDPAAIVEGGEVTVTADGCQPHQQVNPSLAGVCRQNAETLKKKKNEYEELLKKKTESMQKSASAGMCNPLLLCTNRKARPPSAPAKSNSDNPSGSGITADNVRAGGPPTKMLTGKGTPFLMAAA